MAFATFSTSAAADEPLRFDDVRDDIEVSADPDMVEALARDLDLTAEAAYDRLALGAVAVSIEEFAKTQFEDSYAGAWIDAEAADVVVAVTDPDLVADVEDLGGVPEVVDFTLAELEAAKADLDAVGDVATEGVHSWSVDVASNGVVVRAADFAAASELVTASDAPSAAVSLAASHGAPELDSEILGGDPYRIPAQGYRCSIAYSVEHPEHGDGFVTSGHCGDVGDATADLDDVDQGVFEMSVFPDSDRAFVSVNDAWTALPEVNTWDDSSVSVEDHAEVAVGAAVCRSGSTTGWHCGEIEEKGVTVNYADGPVYDMTSTTACSESGDSGGAYMADGSAQGIHSGSTGGTDCGDNPGGVTYFDPINPVLDEFGLTLKTV